MNEFLYSPNFPLGKDLTEYEFISSNGIKLEKFQDKNVLLIDPIVIEKLTERAFGDVSHLLRSSHLKQLRKIIDDPEASDNDRFVALEMIKNANIASAGVLPMCQDTGTAIVTAYKGEGVFTSSDDTKLISHGIFKTYQSKNLRFSQLAPLTMFDEINTNTKEAYLLNRDYEYIDLNTKSLRDICEDYEDFEREYLFNDGSKPWEDENNLKKIFMKLKKYLEETQILNMNEKITNLMIECDL